jgi:hypothetical protein
MDWDGCDRRVPGILTNKLSPKCGAGAEKVKNIDAGVLFCLGEKKPQIRQGLDNKHYWPWATCVDTSNGLLIWYLCSRWERCLPASSVRLSRGCQLTMLSGPRATTVFTITAISIVSFLKPGGKCLPLSRGTEWTLVPVYECCMRNRDHFTSYHNS